MSAQPARGSAEGGDIQLFHLFSRPRCFPQKLQAGFHRGIILEAIDIDARGERLPAVVINQLDDNGLQRKAVQGIVVLITAHVCTAFL